MPESKQPPAKTNGKGAFERAAVPLHHVRGIRIVLDRDVAQAFGTETKRVNEARTRNPLKFSEDHAFQLTKEEFEELKSHSATSKSGRGGATRPPWAYTVKGVGRLAMILNTPEALEASDMILETFLNVYKQLAQGGTELSIANPSRYLPTQEDRKAALAIRRKLSNAVQALLDSVLRVEEQQVMLQVGEDIATGLQHDVIERLRTQGLKNEKLSADTQLVLAEVQKAIAAAATENARARKTHSEADGLDLANVEKRISLVERLLKMNREMEPDAFIDLMGEFSAHPAAKLLE